MKHINNYKIFESKEDIDEFCRQYNIYNYTINEDDSINVQGNVDLWGDGFTKIPLNFNRVSGYFDCQSNQLTSLEGCPKYVGDYFDHSNNELTSLEGGPKYVGGFFTCGNNKITSLEGCPKYVGGFFNCRHNNITSLEGCEYVGDHFYCNYNPVYCIVQYFVNRNNRNDLIELFNYYDIIQDMNVIYDRLKFFYDGINVRVTDKMIKEIENNGYKIIY
jgi:hypothetical protein